MNLSLPRSFPLLFALGFPLFAVFARAAEDSNATASPAPNVVFILADDLGYGDLGAYNPDSRIATPHLDRLAGEGIRFTDAHSGGSTCKPSRYALLSGEFAVRAPSMSDHKGPLLPEGQATIASMLRERGYRTAMVGKWHLGFDQNGEANEKLLGKFRFDPGNMNGGPLDRGFDSYFGMHASLDIPPYFYIRDRFATAAPKSVVEARDSVGTEEDWNHIQGAFWREGGIAEDFVHSEVTPRFCEEACRVISEHDGDQPLLLYLALPSPHTPWLPTEEFRGKSEAGMYGDFVMQVDAVVGEVVASLEDAGMSDNTLVMFSSDNGPVWYDKDTERFGHRSSGVLRGVKGSSWEGGHRMPFIVRWPARMEGGVASNRTVAFCDVFATLAELSGADELPDGVAQDSVSFAAVLLGTATDLPPRPPILHNRDVIRDGDWKLIANSKGGRGFGAPKVKYSLELYHLGDDLEEQNNLAEKMPEKVESLKATIQRILEE